MTDNKGKGEFSHHVDIHGAVNVTRQSKQQLLFCRMLQAFLLRYHWKLPPDSQQVCLFLMNPVYSKWGSVNLPLVISIRHAQTVSI